MRVTCLLSGMMALAAAMPAMATKDESLLKATLTRIPGQSLEALRVTYAPGESSKPHVHDRDAYVGTPKMQPGR